MASDLDELVALLDHSSITTSHGSFVKTENIKKWVEEKRRESLEGAMRPTPRNMNQAKRMAARDEEIFPSRQGPAFHEPGASVSAQPTAADVSST